ncbi:hypothetical protein IAD21_00475 [Abditibacteriota bacterium]|nr:hypothetical protein IAD21_00475 [Abditibacteriota bacterium]
MKNILIEDAGLSDDFSPQYLSSSENIQLVKSKIASIADEDVRTDAFIYFPEALIAAKQWDEAESALDFPKDVLELAPHSLAHSVLGVAKAFLDQGWNQRAYRLAERVLVIAEMINVDNAWEKAEVLNEAGSIFFATGHPQKALETRLYAGDVAAKEQNADIDCSSVMYSITWDLAKNGEFEAARRVAASIRNSVRRQSAFYIIKKEEH